MIISVCFDSECVELKKIENSSREPIIKSETVYVVDGKTGKRYRVTVAIVAEEVHSGAQVGERGKALHGSENVAQQHNEARNPYTRATKQLTG